MSQGEDIKGGGPVIWLSGIGYISESKVSGGPLK